MSKSQDAIEEVSAATKADAANLKTKETTSETGPSFGWNHYAEKINGRFAMIGFVALLITEYITRQDFFSWIGIR